jgi:hypothetical protein
MTRSVQVVNSNLDGTLSLVDKIWNDAMETAALRCEDAAKSLFAADGDSDSWVWPAGRYIERFAQDFREMKRGLK